MIPKVPDLLFLWLYNRLPHTKYRPFYYIRRIWLGTINLTSKWFIKSISKKRASFRLSCFFFIPRVYMLPNFLSNPSESVPPFRSGGDDDDPCSTCCLAPSSHHRITQERFSTKRPPLYTLSPPKAAAAPQSRSLHKETSSSSYDGNTSARSRSFQSRFLC